MKNYIAFYIIIVIMMIVLSLNFFVANTIEYELLNIAQQMKTQINEDKDFTNSYDKLCNMLDKYNVILNTVINNSAFDELEKCVANIGVNKKFNDRQLLEINSGKLVFLIKNIIEQEKCKIHNIL